MRTRYDLSQLDWKLSGWTPELWRSHRTMEVGAMPDAEVSALPAKVPGSVQYSLREAGLLPDWNVGLNFRDCEWVENRNWIFETIIPGDWIEQGRKVRLNCRGLDYSGSVFLNCELVSLFVGSHVPHIFDLTPFLQEGDNSLRIVFDLPPRWLGQFGYTSEMKEWKTRFNYTWDWVVRLVQIGISKPIYLEITDEQEISEFRCLTDADFSASTGVLSATGEVSASDGSTVSVVLSRDGSVVREETLTARQFNESGISWSGFPVELWWPNLLGDQPLYALDVVLLDENGEEADRVTRRVGFRNIAWAQCEGAVEGADPWICVVNGKPTFLQGVNWTPLLPNYADITDEHYRHRLEQYRDLGLNILRVWGGASLETRFFYDTCDELGLMVWQEFPLSSSGIDNWPPDDEDSISSMAEIAKTYLVRRQHHVSLILWCGGNELQSNMEGGKGGGGKPVDNTHPMIARLKEVAESQDPTRRFLDTSSSGPRFYAGSNDFGKGLHWDVHGPWKAEGRLEDYWTEYWTNLDALFCSEAGAPGTSSAEIIRRSAGDIDPMPATAANPLWRRTSPWWIEWDQFTAEIGREPRSLEEYVDWSQERQKRALCIAVKATKDRFPGCGGFIIWMGHDCFPCTSNTAIIDFDGNPKPAALALREIWRDESL